MKIMKLSPITEESLVGRKKIPRLKIIIKKCNEWCSSISYNSNLEGDLKAKQLNALEKCNSAITISSVLNSSVETFSQVTTTTCVGWYSQYSEFWADNKLTMWFKSEGFFDTLWYRYPELMSIQKGAMIPPLKMLYTSWNSRFLKIMNGLPNEMRPLVDACNDTGMTYVVDPSFKLAEPLKKECYPYWIHNESST